MKYGKKIVIFMSISLFYAVNSLQAYLVQFDAHALKYPGKEGTAVLKAVLATMKQAVVYIGADEDSNFKNTVRLVQLVHKEYPDISFVKIDSEQHPSFRIADDKQQISFYMNGGWLHTVTKVKNAAELHALLKKYLR
jgi:hypothetical protein